MQVIHICVCSSSSSSVCVVIWDLGGGGGGGWSLGKVTEQHTAVKTLSRNQKKLFLSFLIFFFLFLLFLKVELCGWAIQQPGVYRVRHICVYSKMKRAAFTSASPIFFLLLRFCSERRSIIVYQPTTQLAWKVVTLSFYHDAIWFHR